MPWGLLRYGLSRICPVTRDIPTTPKLRAAHDGALARQDVAGADEAMTTMLAVRSGDARRLNLRAPLQNATLAAGHAMLAALGSAEEHIGKPPA